MNLKNNQQGHLADVAEKIGAKFEAGKRPWHLPVDTTLSCATQNELDKQDAATLIKNDVICVAEGADMPTTIGAAKAFETANLLYAPHKASNAGGVATSGPEMCQNAQRLSWTHEAGDAQLLQIMQGIHAACLKHGKGKDGKVRHTDSASIAGFVKEADAMLAQGVL
jgi:glutamate dehydrogenase (NADP+)